MKNTATKAAKTKAAKIPLILKKSYNKVKPILHKIPKVLKKS